MNYSLNYYPESNFDKKEWETNIEERYRMSKHIISSKLLIGKTKEEIIEMLGGHFTTYDENHFAYYLGFLSGIPYIDPHVLDIHFENGKVIKVGQHET